jgi:tetratricopeptide (TPR) repeat protein
MERDESGRTAVNPVRLDVVVFDGSFRPRGHGRAVGRARALAFACTLVGAGLANAIELAPLWNFDDPAQSEQRFRAALASATGDDAFVLRTQIARTYGLRGRFAEARAMLRDLEPQLGRVEPEARVRYWLELGRTYASAAHPEEAQTADAKQRAREAYQRAYELAKRDDLDALAVDALHMQAFVDTAPADQLKWGQAALDLSLSSSQQGARAWEASLRNNVGYALLQLGRNDEALTHFQRALALREQGTDAEATWSARWMVARALRALGRLDEALAIQHRIEREREAARKPEADVFEELELLYQAKGDTARAAKYSARRAGAKLRQLLVVSAPVDRVDRVDAGIPPLLRTPLMVRNWQREVGDGNEAKAELHVGVQA